MVAGFLAGVGTIVGLLLFLMLVLFVAGLWALLQEVTSPFERSMSFWQSFGASLGGSLGSVPAYFWSGRWGMLALGLLGAVLGLVDTARVRINRPWHERLGFVVTLAVVAALTFGSLFYSRQAAHEQIAGEPRIFGQQQVFLLPDTTLLSLGSLLAIGIGYVIWVAWSWWYARVTGWLRVPRPEAAPATPVIAAPESGMLAHQARVARLKRPTTETDEQRPAAPASFEPPRSWLPWLAGSLAATILIAYLLMRVYSAAGPAMVSGELWALPEQPRTAVELSFDRPPRRVAVSNTAGVGAVSISLAPAAGGAPARNVDRMPLSPDARRYEIRDLDLRGLQAGLYRLEVGLLEGTGGLLRFVALSGGGWQGQLTAAAIGLALGLCLALAAMLLLELLARGGWSSGGVET